MIWILLSMCLASEQAPITFSKLIWETSEFELSQTDEASRLFVLEQLREAGFNVLGGENALFNKDDSTKARFVLGGKLDNDGQQYSRFLRQSRAKIDWELLDASTNEVVYKTTTRALFDLGFTRRSLPAWAPLNDEGESHGTHSGPAAERLLTELIVELKNRELLQALLQDQAPTEAPKSSFSEVQIASCGSEPLALPKNLQQATSSVRVVQGSEESHGTGVIISSDGYMLTAAHVIEDAGDSVNVLIPGGGLELSAQIIRVNTEQDVALLKLPGKGHSCLANAPTPSLGADIFAVGMPLEQSKSFSIARGIVSGSRDNEQGSWVQTDASISPGYSGGPLLSTEGAIVGIISHKYVGVGVEGISLATPIPEVQSALNVQFAEHSTATIEAEKRQEVSTEVIVENSDVIPFKSTKAGEKYLSKKLRNRRAMLIFESSAIGVGALTSGAAFAAWRAPNAKTEEGNAVIQVVDASGWALITTGATGLFFTLLDGDPKWKSR